MTDMTPFLRQRLGLVVGGSLSAGLDVKLDVGQVPGGIIEDMAVGRYVVVEGATGRKFFSIVTDIALDNANPDLAKSPPAPGDEFAKHIYGSALAFGLLKVAPMLLLEEGSKEPKPVKTIPAHFSQVFEATEEDVNNVFGNGARRRTQAAPSRPPGTAPRAGRASAVVERSSGV